MIRRLREHFKELRTMLLYDDLRIKVQFISVYAILAAVSAFMTVVNIFTKEYFLMVSTMLFAAANLLNIYLSTRGEKEREIGSILFSVEITALFTFFIVSGEPEGFPAIWVCMLPASGLLLFGRKRGTALCAIELAITLFFFYVPFGRSLLQYQYTETFLLRFPMLYAAFFFIAYFLEAIRRATYEALQESRRQYQYLSFHDALTDVYNRYGFNKRMDELLSKPNPKSTALLILDIDFFKNINDRYGHPGGDVVLRELAKLLCEKSGENAAVCRWGGEEFAIILPEASDCGSIAESILSGVRELSITFGEERINVTVSIGMVFAPAETKIDAAALVIQTDRCLYRAKEQGRDRIISTEYIPGA